MNTVVTSKEEILRASRELIRQKGWDAVNIRSVAAACGVSVGSIYNYFDSKAALVGAAVESVWCEIFHRPEDEAVFENTLACVVDFSRIVAGAHFLSDVTMGLALGLLVLTAASRLLRRPEPEAPSASS